MAQITPETRAMLDAQYAEAQPESDADAPEPAFFGVNRRRMDALLTDTQQLEQTASSAALRMMDDVYRQTLHKAELSMAAGATTLPKAIDMAVADFLRAGITCIEYKDGRRVNIADYAEMALRTAATRAKLQGDAALRAQLGVDTVLVSAYGQCSETCLPWQGRVYIDDVFGTFTGDRSGDRGHSANGNWYPLLSVAVRHGLFHPNCRHTLSTWYEGISTMPKPLDAAVVRRNAKLEQQQRALERKLRQAKRLEAGCTDPENVKRYAQQRKDAQKALREFVNAHPDVLRRDAWKEKTYGIDLEKAKKDDIIIADIKREAGIRGVLHLEPTPINVENLAFDDQHINAERAHKVTEQEAREIIQNAKYSISVWGGKFERYYADQGTVYVNMETNLMRTAFLPPEFDARELLLRKVMKKHGK